MLKYKFEKKKKTNISHIVSQGERKIVPVCNQVRIMKTKSGIGLCLYTFFVSEFDLRWLVCPESRQLYHSGKNKSNHNFHAVQKRKCLLLSTIKADPSVILPVAQSQ